MPDERIDTEVLLDEIREEVRRLRAEGKINQALERELDLHLRPDIPPPPRKREVGRMRAALADADHRTAVDVLPESELRGGRIVRWFAKVFTGWCVEAIADQMREFTVANLRGLGAIADVVREVDNDLTRLEGRLEALEDQLRASVLRDPVDPGAAT